MHALSLLQPSRRAWHDGLRLALLNGVLAGLVCVGMITLAKGVPDGQTKPQLNTDAL
jgi:hypothetical protein